MGTYRGKKKAETRMNTGLRPDQLVKVRLRAAADDLQAVVKTVVRGTDSPVHVDYRLTNTPEGWKIFDVNLLGVADPDLSKQLRA